MKFLSNIRVLLIALWLGAAVFFSFAVAPTAFAVLPTRELAGALVSNVLMIVNLSGLVLALVALGGSFVGTAGVGRVGLWTERALLVVVALGCAVGQFVIALWLRFVKAQMGRPIDEMPIDDPLRMQFNNLHEYSVWVLVAAMLAALVAFFVATGRKNAPPAPQAGGGRIDFDKEFKI